MSIESNKILTISAMDYALSVGKQLRHYSMEGVHGKALPRTNALEEFAKLVPSEAEVVVNYDVSIAHTGILDDVRAYARGTALIPKPHKNSRH